MDNINSIQNLHLLISHRELYGTERSLDDILDRPISADLLCLLSILAFASSEENRFRSWSASTHAIPDFHRVSKENYMRERAVFGRLQLFECWKQLLARADALEFGPHNRIELAGTLHELFAHINDRDDKGDPNQLLVQAGIHFAREDYLFKLYRAQKIFLEGQRLAPYVSTLERHLGFELDTYLGVIFTIASSCHLKRKVERFDPVDIDSWAVDLEKVHLDTKIDLGLLMSVMGTIAFTLEDGTAFARDAKDTPSRFELFRNRPFLKLSTTRFLPIEGKLIEELLFDNLLHRLHFASGSDAQFYVELGYEFERYTQGLIEDFCACSTKIEYEYIQEFTYGKEQAKSPDAMIRCKKDNTLLAFEVKSARYLDSILTSENSPEAIAKSFGKLRDAPWKQLHDTIERIVYEHRHPKLIEGLRYLFVAITMNEIPHSLQDYEIKVHGRDVSHCFHSFGIHTLEILLITASLSSKDTIYDILRYAYDARRQISARTVAIRFSRKYGGSSPLLTRIRESAARKYRATLDRHRGEFRGAADADRSVPSHTNNNFP